MNMKKPLTLKSKTIMYTILATILLIAILIMLSISPRQTYTNTPPPTWHYDQELTDRWISENNPSYNVAIYRETFCSKCYPVSINLYMIKDTGVMELLFTGLLHENGDIELNPI